MEKIPQTEPLVYPPDEPHYYQPAPITTRLDDYLPARPLPLIIALLIIAAGAFRLGMLMASPFEYRGWAALVVFSIVGSVWMIRDTNKKEED